MAEVENPPAIAGHSTEVPTDDETTHRKIYSDVSHTRGLGDSGKYVSLVERECPCCCHDRMIKWERVYPTTRATVRYWCLYPNCAHFIGDGISFLCHGNYPQRTVEHPAETWWSDDA